ncbi:hypothetical protein [Streptomyces sp. NPDC059783]|uniref:hypothetical protein n=1 Tax=Streptomyces sp. NPDC059783 TaxID=3346944 RepID=UPI00365791DF
MKRLCETAGFLIFVQGVAGLIHQWVDWFRLFNVVARLPFLRDHGLFVSLVLLVTGVALMIASDAIKEDRAKEENGKSGENGDDAPLTK